MNQVDAFHILSKPAGPICNMNCEYCFYLEKENLYPGEKSFRMPEPVLENYIRQYIETQQAPVITFAWQGGEPTLMGIDFFNKVVELQKKYAGKKSIENAFQTNGVNLDDAWCSFFAENNFLIGISIDGPRNVHDSYRVFKGDQPTFDKVMNGITLLRKHKVEFNTLTCVHRNNSGMGKIIYRFLKKTGSRYMQFIPIVERRAETAVNNLSLVHPGYESSAGVTEWSCRPDEYGRFLSDVFDEWSDKDVGKIYVQMFDVTLANWYGAPPGLCVHSETCGKSLALEHNGDLYSCDHFVYPEYRLGNIMNDSLGDMISSDFQEKFGKDKKSELPAFCRSCEFRFACHGGCPKHRFTDSPDGEHGLNYFCPSYKMFFSYVEPYMKFMVGELHQQRPPSNVMHWKKTLSGK